jgi:DNA-binding beta-propeller fold protein YncE
VPLGLGPVDYAIRLAVTPDGKSIWILANSGRLLVVDAVRLRVAQNVILMASPGFAFGAKIVFSPDGKLAYVAAIHYIDRFGDIAQEVLVVCGITKQVLAKLSGDGTGDESPGIALSPDGNRLYVVNRSRFPDFSGGSVWVYSTITRKLVDVIPLKSPTDAIVTPDGKDVWVGYEFNGTESSKVAVVDIATNNVVRTLAVAIRGDVLKTAFTPDGKYLWIPAGFNSGGNTVFAFPTSSANIAYSIVVGNGPAAIAFPH